MSAVGRIGARVHDMTSEFFEKDVAVICKDAAKRLAYLVVPKVDGAADFTNDERVRAGALAEIAAHAHGRVGVDDFVRVVPGCIRLDDLPANARRYLDYVVKAVGAPMAILSIGAGREQTIRLGDVF